MNDKLRFTYLILQLAASGLGILGGMELVAWAGR